MKVDKRANFCIFFLITILALGLSNFAAAYTGDLVSSSFPGLNDTDKMIALDDDNFAPLSLNAVYEKKVVEEVNETETEANSTIEEKIEDNSDQTDDNQESENTDNNNNNNNNNNQNSDSNTNNNDNSGTDSSDSTPSEGQTDSGEAEE